MSACVVWEGAFHEGYPRRRRDERYAVRRREPQLPRTAAFAHALEVDETPVEPFEEALPIVDEETE